MIHNGECGSYNPLLLRCLDDVSDTAKQGMKDAGQTVAPLRRVVEELYKGQDLAAARMTQQLEDAYASRTSLPPSAMSCGSTILPSPPPCTCPVGWRSRRVCRR